MRPHDNTRSVIAVNALSVNEVAHNLDVPAAAKTSQFWDRLTKARTTHNPPMTMNQKAIAKETGMAFQSAVTKWKTGGPDGSSMPRPEIVLELARRAKCSFEWLYSGEGEMRPRYISDPVVQHILDAVEKLEPEGRIEVFKAAVMQKTLEQPLLAEQMRAAYALAEKITKPYSRRATK